MGPVAVQDQCNTYFLDDEEPLTEATTKSIKGFNKMRFNKKVKREAVQSKTSQSQRKFLLLHVRHKTKSTHIGAL